ncbi:ECF transporter S component [Candidatus Bathyarchaeota archaeon]|nr:ECF transporter S component [Candidatus Bathyarchaeota archaeon]
MGSVYSSAARRVAFTCIFAAVYAILSSWSLFPVIGAPGKFITLSSMVAPLMGMLLGPKVGLAATSIGGFLTSITGNMGAFGPLSFVPGASSALFSGLIREGRRGEASALYSASLAVFMFYPNSGPVWTFPPFLWLQLSCLVLILSPILPKVRVFLNGHDGRRLMLAVAYVAFTSTLFGHVVGSLMFEAMFNGSFTRCGWRLLWQSLTFVYPIERCIITASSTLIGFPLIKTLNSYTPMRMLER